MMGSAEIHLVVPDLFDRQGGIARLSRALSLALCEWADVRQARLIAHALVDGGDSHDSRYLPMPHGYRAYSGNRKRLADAVLRGGWQWPGRTTRGAPPMAVLFAHVNLSVLALALPPWIPIGVIAHGIDVHEPLRWDRSLALKRVDVVWAVSRDTRDHVIEVQGLPADRTRVIHNGLDPFWPIPTQHARGTRHVIAIARLDPRHAYKGIDLTLRALSLLPQPERPRLVIAGDGPDRPRLIALANELAVTADFVGSVEDAELVRLLADASAFVLPSTREGFGLVFLEAMAMGLPCIAANAGGAPEVVEHGRTGVLVEPGDVEALARAIALVTAAEGQRMGVAGRERVLREFTYAAYRGRVHAALDELVGLRSRTSLGQSR